MSCRRRTPRGGGPVARPELVLLREEVEHESGGGEGEASAMMTPSSSVSVAAKLRRSAGHGGSDGSGRERADAAEESQDPTGASMWAADSGLSGGKPTEVKMAVHMIICTPAPATRGREEELRERCQYSRYPCTQAAGSIRNLARARELHMVGLYSTVRPGFF